MEAALDRDGELAEFVHDVHVGDVLIASLFNGLPVLPDILPVAAVCRTAFHNRSVKFLHQIADQLWTQVIAFCALPC